MNFWAFLGIAAVLIGGFLFVRRYDNNTNPYRRPIPFDCDGEGFIWVPAPEAERPAFRKLYECGSFLYADGTPVTDFQVEQRLQAFWIDTNRREMYFRDGI
jgi:hypothetical protein